MRVFLDTSIIKAEGYYFQSAAMQAVMEAAKQLGIILLIPEVVYQETCENHRRDLEAELGGFKTSVDSLNRLLERKLHQQDIESIVTDTRQLYWGWLLNRLVLPPFRRLPLPAIDLDRTMMRAVRKEAPFGGKNDGFKDYLIWMTILEEIKAQSDDVPVHFITGNIHDFAGNPRVENPELHPMLKWDLADSGLPEDAVRLHKSARDFRLAMIDPHLESMDKLARQIESETFPNTEFYKLIPTTIEEWFPRATSLSWLQVPDYVSRAISLKVQSVGGFRSAQATSYPDGRRVVDVQVTALCDLSVEVEQDTKTGRAFASNATEEGLVAVQLRRSLRFIISTIMGEDPENEIIRMDAILIRPPYPDEKVQLGWLPVHS